MTVTEHQSFNTTDGDGLAAEADGGYPGVMVSCNVGTGESVTGISELKLIVTTTAARDCVIARTTNLEQVVTATTHKGITTGAGDERIVAAITLKQLVSSAAADQQVVAAAADERVKIAAAANQRIIAVAAMAIAVAAMAVVAM